MAKSTVKAAKNSSSKTSSPDKKKRSASTAVENSAQPTDFVERRQPVERRKVQRRRQIDPTTCERDYSVEEIEFMRAMDDYKRNNGRMFPTCSEILEVLRDLGYRRDSAAAPQQRTEPLSSDQHASPPATDS